MGLDDREYGGHLVELRSSDSSVVNELLIDGQPVSYGRLPGGLYFLNQYAYDWREDLFDLSRRFIDYRSRVDAITSDDEAGA